MVYLLGVKNLGRNKRVVEDGFQEDEHNAESGQERHKALSGHYCERGGQGIQDQPCWLWYLREKKAERKEGKEPADQEDHRRPREEEIRLQGIKQSKIQVILYF